MTTAKCTEDGANQPKFDFTLIEGLGTQDKFNPYKGPYIDFELPDGCWEGEYEGPGVFWFSLEVLLEEFLKTYWNNSHGELTPKLIKMLREYADKIEQDIACRREGK